MLLTMLAVFTPTSMPATEAEAEQTRAHAHSYIDLYAEECICEGYEWGFRIITKRYYGVDSYVGRFGPTEWWDWYSVTFPGDISIDWFDLLVYKNPPCGESCCDCPFLPFPPTDYYYGRITPDGTFLDKNDNPTNFPESDYYYITTGGFVKYDPIEGIFEPYLPPWGIGITVVACAPPPPQTRELELYPREVLDLEDPTCTLWHELHPVKGNYYHLTHWEPGVVLSPSDEIVMEPVEPPGPIEEFEVDELTVELVVIDEETGIEHWLDYDCGYWTFDPENPISTKWNEIKPDPELCWHLTSWEDNGDGRLSFCDWIETTLMYPWGPAVMRCHVEQVTVTLKL